MPIQERIISAPIEDEMKESYIDYAMSVIVARALPDAADGLKPVHRRILYSMLRQNILPGRAYKKSASTVGDVLGKYHPHGDSSVYDAMVRMAQDFNLRYLMVDGHGNFGSIDGDPPAAMRYTESRLAPIAMEMLMDLDKETVNFVPNFDNSHTEPQVLPAKIPNLLVNGSSGIAVGMATNIPPHNLGEVVDALVQIIDAPDTEDEQLYKIVKAPDFPTGGYIIGTEGAKKAYSTGKGSVIMRAVTDFEEKKGGRTDIIVTEIPYQVNKARLVEQIATLVRDKKISGIRDIRDESDRTGMRIVIELTSTAVPKITLNQLYKHTAMQCNFNINMLALVDNVPKTLTLREALDYYLKHRFNVVTNRSRFELKKAKARAHILEGLIIALDNIDEVIQVIRSSKDTPEAKSRLISRFRLSEEQSQAILDMRLQRLTGLERSKIEEEYAELIKLIAYLEDLLASDRKIYGVIREELVEVKNKYGDNRRSKILRDIDTSFEAEDLIQETKVFVTISHAGYIKRFPLTAYKRQKRGGKGIGSSKLKEEDFIEHTFVTTTHHYLLFFTDKAKVYKLKVYEVPEMSRVARGSYLKNLVQISKDEKITAIIPIKEFGEGSGYLTMCTRMGMMKRTLVSEYSNIFSQGIRALNLEEDDELVSVHQTSGTQELFIITRFGKAVHFKEEDVRVVGRVAKGVKTIKLRPGDGVVAMDYVDKGTQVLMITEYGIGKRTPFEEFPLHSRRCGGVIAMRVTEKSGNIVRARVLNPMDEVIVTTSQGYVIRLLAQDVSLQSRATQGVIMIRLDPDDQVTGFSIIPCSSQNKEIKENFCNLNEDGMELDEYDEEDEGEEDEGTDFPETEE
jgi:DNA gyrase subunit A